MPLGYRFCGIAAPMRCYLCPSGAAGASVPNCAERGFCPVSLLPELVFASTEYLGRRGLLPDQMTRVVSPMPCRSMQTAVKGCVMASLPYDIRKCSTWLGMEQAKLIVGDVATNRRRMALLCSPTGFGKSLLTRRKMKQHKVPFHETSVSTESALVQVLWDIERGAITHRGRKPVCLLADDSDGFMRKPTLSNQLKSVLGADRSRVIYETPPSLRNENYRMSDDAGDKRKYRPSVPPPMFETTIRYVQLANVNYSDPAVVAGLSEHFLALVSKGLDPHWVSDDAERDGFDTFIFTHWLATEGKSLVGEGFGYEVARAAVEFYVRHINRLIDICPRRLSQIASVIRNNSNLDERAARLAVMLRPTDQRPRLILPQTLVRVLIWPPHPPRRPDLPPDEPEEQTTHFRRRPYCREESAAPSFAVGTEVRVQDGVHDGQPFLVSLVRLRLRRRCTGTWFRIHHPSSGMSC